MTLEVLDATSGMTTLTLTGTPAEVRAQRKFVTDLIKYGRYMDQLAAQEERDAATIHSGPTMTVAGTIETTMTPAGRGDFVILSWVADEDIPKDVRWSARKALDRIARKLGLGFIRLRWFGPQVGEGDFLWVSPTDGSMPLGTTPGEQAMTIALNEGLRGDQLVLTLAHECRHVAQNITRAMLEDRFAREQDADDFAAEYMREIQR